MTRKHQVFDRRRYVHVSTDIGTIAILASQAERLIPDWLFFDRFGGLHSFDPDCLLRLPDSFMVR